VPLSEAYGLTEASAATTVNPPGRARFGTVGTPLPGVAVKLAADGEILVKGPGVMKGYLNQPDATAAAFDEEGWLRTGDIGALDGDGYLRIVGRKKEIIINAAGKNISPAYIESHLLAASPLIATAVAIGDARPYIVALLTLEPAELERFATAHGLPRSDPAGLVDAAAVRDEIARAVARANDNLSRVEQLKTFRILPAAWVPGGDELTATMKLKRSVITEKYQHQIDDLYRSQETDT
jgi:long-subunit acyl-CoA synthetase (AMP-forming)